MNENPYQSPQFVEDGSDNNWFNLLLPLIGWSGLGLGWFFLLMGFSIWGHPETSMFFVDALIAFAISTLTFAAILIGQKHERR
jgi:hypothetical protein